MALQRLSFNTPGVRPQAFDVALGTLSDALDAEVPTRQIDRNLLVASWNIRGLSDFTQKWVTEPGDSPKRNLADLHYIAEIISRFDVVAVQETRDSLTALRTIMRLLGPDWGLLMSDVTAGAKGNHERLGYLFDLRRVRPSGLVGELVVSPEMLKKLRATRLAQPFASDHRPKMKPNEIEAAALESEFGGQLDRTPYVASFTSAGRPFMLATVHIVWGVGGDLERRAEEAGLLASMLAETVDGDEHDDFRANLIALGDFNATSATDPIVAALEAQGMVTAAELDGAPRTVNDDKDGAADKIAYDQFAWFPPESRRRGALALPRISGASFEWDKHVLGDDPSKDFKISDHYPIWLELSVRE
jgi:endonuclease/exonuclease/phosphatase family metal-dependent hydrolase